MTIVTLKDFIFEQKCIPWRTRKWFCHKRNMFFNINTKKYWDTTWEKEILQLSEFRDMENLYSKIVNSVPGGSAVLDVGCGMGILMNMLQKIKHCEVFGIDISERAISSLSENGMSGIAKKIPPIPFDSESFDAVVSTELLEHVEKPFKVIEEIFRVTKKAGICFLSVPHNSMHPYQEREHLHSFTKENLNKLIRKINNEIEVELFAIKEKNNSERLLAILKK
jgi:2-polyprenyl-3-methyl-5-hydroxy-6-metoxy-1,4-benzoquinol methylase